MRRFVYATVTATGPLRVHLDGDTVTNLPAVAYAGFAPSVGQRVRVEITGAPQRLVVRAL